MFEWSVVGPFHGLAGLFSRRAGWWNAFMGLSLYRKKLGDSFTDGPDPRNLNVFPSAHGGEREAHNHNDSNSSSPPDPASHRAGLGNRKWFIAQCYRYFGINNVATLWFLAINQLYFACALYTSIWYLTKMITDLKHFIQNNWHNYTIQNDLYINCIWHCLVFCFPIRKEIKQKVIHVSKFDFYQGNNHVWINFLV